MSGRGAQVFSLRTKLVVFAAALVVIPGGIYGAITVSGSREAMARVVGRQFVEGARNAADQIATMLRSEQERIHWLAAQDVMREIRIGDFDKRISSLLRIAHAVSFYGWVKEVRQFLAQGDIFVLPSLKESFGLTVLEAMAAQLPVIATRTPGPRQILDDACGYLVAVGGVKALAQAMHLAALDKEARIQKARLAQQRFISAFSKEAVIPRYLALYQTAREYLPHS